MARPCNGRGGTPRPGADTDAGIFYEAQITAATRAAFERTNRFSSERAIDPDEVVEAIERGISRASPDAGDRFVPRAYGGAPLHFADLMSFCSDGVPPVDEIPSLTPGGRAIAHMAISQSWYNNCTCEPQPPPGQIPVYPHGCTSYGHHIGEYHAANGAVFRHEHKWTCLEPPTYYKGLPTGQPYFRYTADGRYAWCLDTEDFMGRPGVEVLTPESGEPDPRRHIIVLCDYHPCPGCTVQPIRPPIYRHPTPSIILPPIPPIPPPTFPELPILIILPPTDCQFTAECKQKLNEVHEVLGTDGFPAKLPETLYDPSKEGEKSYKNYAELMEWLIVQIDGLFGEFPIKIKYKDANNEQQEIKVENQSEAMAEVLGLLIGIAADTETNTQMGMKAIVETIRATAAATLASDYGRANAEFLGYRSKNTQSDIKLSITPGADNLKKALEESTRKIQRYEFSDNADLQDYLRQILVGVGIVKAAFLRPFGGIGDFLPGDRIRDEVIPPPDGYETQEDAIWRRFREEINTPPSRYRRDGNLPSVQIDNINTQDPPNTSETSTGGSR